jgi:hypothetical protein
LSQKKQNAHGDPYRKGASERLDFNPFRHNQRERSTITARFIKQEAAVYLKAPVNQPFFNGYGSVLPFF